ncbi:MAG TPA: cation diffusion facilitator family transporter [Ignavibacteria bacterium]|nr:cation diffusion facilitator family transporter [Ignavibacteria bacterium]
MEHEHNHIRNTKNINTAFIIGISLNLLYTLIEFGAGFYYNSLVLLSDAGHNLSDVASLMLSLIAFKLSQVAATKRFTFGYKRGTILASFVNAVVLMIVIAGVLKEAIERLAAPPEANGLSISAVALIGILINSVTALLFFKDKESDINIKGAYLHLAMDAVVSLGAVVSGLVIYYTGWVVVDPVVSIGIAVVIIISTWGLLKESIFLSTDAVPKGINTDRIREAVLNVKGVKDVHHIHVWAMSTTENSLTMHVILNGKDAVPESAGIKKRIKEILYGYNIHHATLELEIPEENCCEPDC